MKRLLIAGLLIWLALPALAKPKKPKPPSQDHIVQGCIAVRDIQSTKRSDGAVWGLIESTCGDAVMVTLVSGFFGKDGSQDGSNFVVLTVASNAHQKFYIRGKGDWLSPHSAKLIKVVTGPITASWVEKPQ